MEFDNQIASLKSIISSIEKIKNIDYSINQINRKEDNISDNKLYMDTYEKHIVAVDNLAATLKDYSVALNWQLIITKANNN